MKKMLNMFLTQGAVKQKAGGFLVNGTRELLSGEPCLCPASSVQMLTADRICFLASESQATYLVVALNSINKLFDFLSPNLRTCLKRISLL